MTRVLLVLLVALAVGGGAAASGADFTASSASPGNAFAAAADFNTVAVSLSAPAGTLMGNVSITATATSDRGIASVKFQYAPTGTADWVDLCTDTTFSYGCPPWNTAALADGVYDLRAIATDSAGYARTSATVTRTTDNYTLTVTLADPGSAISATKQLTATATGAAGGLQSVTIQHRAVGATTWTDLCTGATSPQQCNLVTTGYADGPRELRAIARDNSGGTAQTAVFAPSIDNSPPAGTPSIPPSGSGQVTMTATADDSGSGIAWVAFEALYQGTWYEFCRDSAAPFTCSGDSAQVADGNYQIRIRIRNNAGVETVSDPFPITIDNTAPSGSDVQAGNAGGGTAGRLESGDWVRLTWTEPILPSSVLAGWDGTSTPVRVKVTDAPGGDQMDVYDAAGNTRLNLAATGADLKLGGNLVSANVDFQATMARSGSSITVTLSSQVGTGGLLTAVAGTMTWKSSTGATDAAAHPSNANLVTESGAADVDF